MLQEQLAPPPPLKKINLNDLVTTTGIASGFLYTIKALVKNIQRLSLSKLQVV